MNLRKLIAIILVAGGVLALVYRSVTLPTERKEAKLGPLEFSLQKKERFEIPVWVGVVAIAAGGALLLVNPRS